MAGESAEVASIEESHSNLETRNEIMEGIASDKVNINVGGGGEGYGGGGAGLAAVIAALGNRNQGQDHAALIAALGNRNEKDYGPLMAMLAGDRHRRDDDCGFGGGGLGLVALLALLGRRGGFGGGDDCGDGHGHDHTALVQSIMEGVGNLRAQVPQTSLEVRNALCQEIGALALGMQQGFANTKDSVQAAAAVLGAQNANTKDTVQNGFAITNNNLLEGLCSVKQAVRDDGDRTRAQIALYHEGNLQRQLAVAESALAEERNARRVRDVEVSVSNQATAIQSQSQEQRQRQSDLDLLATRLLGGINSIANQVQRVRSENETINFGTMAASGNNATTSTAVR